VKILGYSDEESAMSRGDVVAVKLFGFIAEGFVELMQRDKASLDIFWLKDESLEDSDNLPAPEVLAAEIVESLETALEQFKSIYEELGKDQTLELKTSGV